MKNFTFYKRCLLLFLAVTHYAIGQSTYSVEFTPKGIFDKVYDQLGNAENLEDIQVNAPRKLGNTTSVTANYAYCTAGYFTLYFQTGSLFALNPGTQSVICQVFTDISNYIVSPASPGQVKIHIGVSTTAPGLAYSYFLSPTVSGSLNLGIEDNLVYKVLTSGVDPFSVIPFNSNSPFNPGSFYHGRIEINPILNYNFNLSTSTVSASEIDLYAICLHEATHLLGVYSLIGYNGQSNSLLFSNNSMFARYDRFLASNNGTPLIAAVTPSCPMSASAFSNSTLSVAAGGNCANTALNVTECSLAAQYVGSSTIAVFTPTCYQPGSSLSHFEDMCTSSGFSTSCTPSPLSPGYNDMIFVMSNAVATGSCYVKRHWQNSERLVLCDLNYSTNSTFGSTLVADSYTAYPGGCTGTLPVGVYDGYQNNNYVFVTTGNSAVINHTALTQNDISLSTLSVCCMDAITPGSSVSEGVNSCTVTAPNGSGLVVFRYFPLNSFGVGNPTYVFVYFLPASCSNGNSCNLIRNAGFESSASNVGLQCGLVGSTYSLEIDCWENYEAIAHLFHQGCATTGFQPGINTAFSSSPVNTLNVGGVTNNNFVALKYGGSNFSTPAGTAIKSLLTSTLQNGQSYTFSGWFQNMSKSYTSTTNQYFNPDNNPIVVTIASTQSWVATPTLNFPTGLNVLASFTIPASQQWSYHTATFTPSVAGIALVVGINVLSTSSPTNFSSLGYYYLLADELSLVPTSTVSFAVATPTICGAKGIENLLQFSSLGTGTITGTGVTLNGTQFDFNVPPTLPTGTYALNYSYSNGSCITSTVNIVSLPLITNCCTSTTIPTFTASTLSTGLSGPVRVVNDFTVNAANVSFLGEILFSPSVQVSIANGANLTIFSSHLYSCGNEMWNGIKVNDGGALVCTGAFGGSNLIEDAKVAIDVPNHTTSNLTSIVSLDNTIFNKNYISLRINNYARNNNTYPFKIESCVFTCRNIVFNGTTWPSAGFTSSVSGSAGYLRYSASTATNGLASPYLNQAAYSMTNLKAPYSSQPSHAAIALTNVGTTSSASFYGIEIGSASNGTLFNVFDGHGYSVWAINSNVALRNNVFQNTQRYYVPPVGISAGVMFGGNAINDENYYMNSKLDLTSSSVNLGNRFWNCHTAIKAQNLLRLNVEKALFRSTQINTTSSFQQGSNGLQLSTNRFQYFIKDNEFSNIAYPINIPIAAGTYTSISTGTQSGIYADKIIVLQNTFASGSTTGQNINTAVNITCPNQFPFTMANDYNIVPYTKAIVVEQNTMTAVERGIAINGITGFQTTVESNSISLRSGAVSQHGIDLSACVSASNAVGQQMIITNTITGAAPSASLESLVFCSDNIGIYSPSVTCNALSNSHQGFVFNSTNTLAVWAGNIMQPMNRGIVLTGNGRIGAQGTASISSNNEWRSTWTNYHTYVDAASNSTNSVLYVKTGGVTEPTLNSGPQSSQNFDPSNNSIFFATGGDYECGGVPNSKVINPPNAEDFDAPIGYSTIRHVFYRFLAFNDSIRDAGNACDDYYQSLSASNTDKFLAIEDELYQGDVAGALSINDDITIDGTDVLEENCKGFYQLYANYLQLATDSIYSAADSAALYYLANLCPAGNGPCVYQARALINTIYQVTPIYSDCDEETGARAGRSDILIFTDRTVAVKDLFRVYPNPAGDEVKILYEKADSGLTIEITDLLGRTILAKDVKIQGNIVTIALGLPNGAYLLKISGNQYEQTTKKLLISK